MPAATAIATGPEQSSQQIHGRYYGRGMQSMTLSSSSGNNRAKTVSRITGRLNTFSVFTSHDTDDDDDDSRPTDTTDAHVDDARKSDSQAGHTG